MPAPFFTRPWRIEDFSLERSSLRGGISVGVFKAILID
jgi:hypothetical protein